MTLYSVQEFTKGCVQGVVSPNWKLPAIAYVQPPVPGNSKLDQPMIFVWGASQTESRTAIPRAKPGVNPMLAAPGTTVESGWKQTHHSISMWIYGVQLIRDPNGGSKFPVLIEQIKNALRMQEVPVLITDSQTGEHSTVMDIGEEFACEYDVDRTLADQRLLRNTARLDVAVLEEFQF